MSGEHPLALPSAGRSGSAARGEICKHSGVGERLRLLCLQACRAGSAHVAQAVLSGQEEESTACLGAASQGGSLRHSPCLARCCLQDAPSTPSALTAALLQVKPRLHLGEPSDSSDSGHRAPRTHSGAAQLHRVSAAFLSCLDDGEELLHCRGLEQAQVWRKPARPQT